MNTLLCIGCNDYEFVGKLGGGERDAAAVFDLLSQQEEIYPRDRSFLLCSPSLEELTTAVAKCFPAGEAVEVFTLFFAGHGAKKSGSFYLLPTDARVESLSTSAFPLSRLFEIINEVRPRQANIIIDACEAGGSSVDIGSLLKPEEAGTLHGASVSFLGACTADQSASEDDKGGYLTVELVKVLKGEVDLQLCGSVISLGEIAPSIAETVRSLWPDQQPVWWGLSLFGHGVFARNPRISFGDSNPSIAAATISPSSEIGTRLTEFSEQLWNEYRLVRSEFDPSRLHEVVRRLLAPDTLSADDRVNAVAGLMITFSTYVASEHELLARYICDSVFLVALLPWSDREPIRVFVRDQLRVQFERNCQLQAALAIRIAAEDTTLLSRADVMADFYYLPLRVTRLLGWAAETYLLGQMFGWGNDKTRSVQRNLVSAIMEQYPKSLVAVSDEQAAPLYLFIKIAAGAGWTEWGREVVQSFYLDLAVKEGQVTRCGTEGKEALEYILKMSGSPLAGKWLPATPSLLIPIVLLGGVWYGVSQDWDLEALDRRSMVFFLPNTYHDFNQKVIDHGTCFTDQIGSGIWHAEELHAQFETAKTDFGIPVLSAEEHALCVLASGLFPDRVALNLEAHPWKDSEQAVGE